MAATKKLVSFDSEAFNSKMAEWKKKKELEKDIIAKTKFMFGSLDWTLKPSDLFPSPHLKIHKLIEKVFADQNPMGLSGKKLAELKDIDVTELLSNQVYQYLKLERFIKAYKDFFKTNDLITVYHMEQIIQATNTRIVRGRDNQLMANPQYVKDAI
ncbi:MAG TPA: hypothetical protein DIT52_01140 [Flavobacteriaceae bacterium]|nr:hypothetical protein [Flavobacteriaceae bacterium]